MGFFAAVSYRDVEPKQRYIENYTGEGKLLQGRITWNSWPRADRHRAGGARLWSGVALSATA